MSADLTGQQLGHYQVLAVLGTGGMSTVYRAVDTRLDRPVALKVISENLSSDDEFRQRFVEEARAASAIDHVNVVPLYDFGEAGNWLYIAMRLVEGTDLAQEIAIGALEPRRAIDLLSQAGGALDMLHERGLVHLDVKPANVLITRSESLGKEHVYLADFGLTRRGATGHRTASGDFLGSPTYASPEHLRGEEVHSSSDLYSLTCVLFTCLAGRAPFTGTVKEVVTGHLRGQVPSLSAMTGLPSAIDRVIARGLAADPTSRYGSSAELLGSARRAITAYDDEPASAPQGSGPTDRPTEMHRQQADAETPGAGQQPWGQPSVEGATSAIPGAKEPETSLNLPGLAVFQGAGSYDDPDRTGPTTISPPHTAPRNSDRKAWWWVLAGILVLAVAGVVIFLIARSGDNDPSPLPSSGDVETSASVSGTASSPDVVTSISAIAPSVDLSSSGPVTTTTSAKPSTSPRTTTRGSGSVANSGLPTLIDPSQITNFNPSDLTLPPSG